MQRRFKNLHTENNGIPPIFPNDMWLNLTTFNLGSSRERSCPA